MFQSLFAVLLMAGLAAPSWSATCTARSADPLLMTSQTTDGIWSGDGCGPSATDDYVIPSGFEVMIDADGNDIGMHSLTVSGGKLTIIGDTHIDIPEFLSCTSGALKALGNELATVRLAAVGPMQPSNDLHTVTVEGDLTGMIDTATTMIVVGDDDSATPNALLAGPIQTFDGPPVDGYYRPSFAKWNWLPITAAEIDADGNTMITYALEQFTLPEPRGYYGTYDADVYRGSRFPTATSYDVTKISNNDMGKVGHFSTLTVADGSVIQTDDADLGKWYVKWIDGPCAGEYSKILNTWHNAEADDEIVVMGPHEQCWDNATINIELSIGLRPGDPVHLVNPVTIDLQGTGWTSWDISECETDMNFVQFHRGDQKTSNILVPGGFGSDRGIHAFYAELDRATAASSEVTNTEWAYFGAAGATQDATAVGFLQRATETTTISAGTHTNLTFDRAYIHDQAFGTGTSSQLSCFMSHAAKNSKVSRLRSERCAGYLVGSIGGPPTLSGDFDELLVFDQKPGSDRVSVGSRFSVTSKISGADISEARAQQGTIDIGGMMVMGVGDITVSNETVKSIMTDFIIGGNDSASGPSNNKIHLSSPFGNATHGWWSFDDFYAYGPTHRNILIYHTNSGNLYISGCIEDSVVSTVEYWNGMSHAGCWRRSYYSNVSGPPLPIVRIITGGTAGSLHAKDFEFTDNVIVFPRIASWAQNFSVLNGYEPGVHRFTRNYVAVTQTYPRGLMGVFEERSMMAPEVHLDGMIITETAGTNHCIFNDETMDFGDGIQVDEEFSFGDFQQQDAGDFCNDARPIDYGLSRITTLHALGGTIFIRNLERFTTRRDLISVPEPNQILGLSAGIMALGVLSRRGRH